MSRVVLAFSLALAAGCAADEPDTMTTDEVADALANVIATDSGGDIAEFWEVADEDLAGCAADFTTRPSGTYTGTWTFDWGSFTYDLSKQFYDGAGAPVATRAEAWSAEWMGTTTATVDLARYDATFVRTIPSMIITGHEDASNQLVMNGTTHREGTSRFESPRWGTSTDHQGSWDVVWTDITIDKCCIGTGNCPPISGTVTADGTISAQRDGRRRDTQAQWAGTVTLTFNGTNQVEIQIDGAATRTVDIQTGAVTG